MHSENNNQVHSDLTFLENLKRYTLDSKMKICQIYASRIMSLSEVSSEYILKQNITPWELETFAAFSVIYDNSNATAPITVDVFEQIITLIRNYWHPELTLAEKNGTYADVFMMISIIQQFPTQGLFLQKMFRYDYFFHFKNEKVNMEEEFIKVFGIDYQKFEIFAFILFVSCSVDAQNKIGRKQCEIALMKAFSIPGVLPHLKVTLEKYKELLNSQYKGNVLDYYYGLKIQYLYPFIEGNEYIYIPSPYLVINAVTESMLNRLTLGKSNLRKKFGKEVVEEYLFSIYKENPAVTWINREFEYKKGKNSILTPDLLVEESNCALLFDTKALAPSLKMRQFDKEEVDVETGIYADNILQIYQRILDLQDGYYKLNNTFEQKDVFGVVVVLEDAAIAKHSVYEKVFKKLSENGLEDTSAVRDYIHSHIKVVPLNQIEQTVLIGHSYMECLHNQMNSRDMWNNYTFFIPKEKFDCIPSYKTFNKRLKSAVADILKKAPTAEN